MFIVPHIEISLPKNEKGHIQFLSFVLLQPNHRLVQTLPVSMFPLFSLVTILCSCVTVWSGVGTKTTVLGLGLHYV